LRVLAVIFMCLVVPAIADAEQDELTFGAEAGLMLPDYSPQSATAPTLATWTTGVLVSYGVLDDLSITTQFNFSMFDATAGGYTTTVDTLPYTGELKFSGRFYHPQVGARYKVLSGYNIAPYVEAGLGYAWTTIHAPVILDDEGRSFGLGLGDWGEGTWTVAAGLVVDYRISNLLFVGLTGRFVYALESGLLNHYTTVVLQAQYYW
jgi:hypothetical protein